MAPDRTPLTSLAALAARARSALRDRIGSPLASEPARREAGTEMRATIMSLPLFDQAWVEAQVGRRFASADAALDAYLATPDCSPHPLFMPEYIDPAFGRPEPGRDHLAWYLRRPGVHRSASPHPLVDLDVLAARHPDLPPHRFGPVVAWLEQASDDSPLPTPGGFPPITLGEVRDVSHAAAAEWAVDQRHRMAPRRTDEPLRGALDPETVPLVEDDAGEPLVSIVMPMWNRATSVRRAIESVQGQSLASWELIVVDDGSADDGPAIVAGIAAFDPRVVLVRADHGGVCRARNEGLARARGTFVAFLDTDNRWRPDFLKVMVGQLDSRSWEMAHAALQATQDGTTYHRAYAGTHADLLVSNYIDLNVLVVRRELLRRTGGFDESLRRGVDWDLILRLAERTPLHLVPYIGVDYHDDAESGAPRISTVEPFAWMSVIASRHLARANRHEGPRQQGLTSVCIADPGSVRVLSRWQQELAGREDVELVVAVVGLSLWRHVAAAVTTYAARNARLIRLQVDRGRAVPANVALAAARGDRAVVALADVHADFDAVQLLVGALDDESVGVAAPVTFDRAGCVDTAGATVAPGSPWPVPFLGGHSLGDLTTLGTTTLLAAAFGPVFAVRTSAIERVGDLEPLFEGRLLETDLSLRISEAGAGDTVLVARARFQVAGKARRTDQRLARAATLLEQRWSRIGSREHPAQASSTAAWEAAGFGIDGYDYVVLGNESPRPADQPMLVPRPRVRPLGPSNNLQIAEAPPVLRWTIDLASPAGPVGAWWGDSYFGQALAAALRRRGQVVNVDSREARHRQSRDLDDVILVLRGLDQVRPRPGRLNLEWIISHPELVTAAEVAGFDAVFAASHSWAAGRSTAWGTPIEPLLQATDPHAFHADQTTFDTGDEVVFVGNSRNVFRSSVRHARTAGLDVAVHGSGWEELIGADAVSSRFVPNGDLGRLYCSAGLVLNDHWEDMRTSGFVSNRLMDAAAAGARVASDALPGVDLPSLFHGLVQTFDDAAGLTRLVEGRATLYPDDDDRVAAASRVAADHSFDARAGVLLNTAADLWLRDRRPR